jgi:hypothetical protein
MEPIKVNEGTHNNLINAHNVKMQAESNIALIMTTLGVPSGWVYSVDKRQFEPKEQPANA